MGRIYDYAKKLEADGIYSSRETEFFNPNKQDSSTAIRENGMATEQVEDYIRMMMQDTKRRQARKQEGYDTESF